MILISGTSENESIHTDRISVNGVMINLDEKGEKRDAAIRKVLQSAGKSRQLIPLIPSLSLTAI